MAKNAINVLDVIGMQAEHIASIVTVNMARLSFRRFVTMSQICWMSFIQHVMLDGHESPELIFQTWYLNHVDMAWKPMSY